jgi:hypothetical protein
MRTVPQYIELVKEKYNEDNPVTGITLKECVDFVVDTAFFEDEITAPIIDPLKEKILAELKK